MIEAEVGVIGENQIMLTDTKNRKMRRVIISYVLKRKKCCLKLLDINSYQDSCSAPDLNRNSYIRPSAKDHEKGSRSFVPNYTCYFIFLQKPDKTTKKHMYSWNCPTLPKPNSLFSIKIQSD